ncbi:MAG TPA: divergent polysaccharide deacetylase family protein [Rhizomicrobium sp.]
MIRRPRKEPLALRGADAVFAGLLALAICAGGPAVLSGLPKFLDAMVPSGAAEASAIDTERYAPVPPLDGASSPMMPQVLFPVTGHPFPEWLTSPLARLTPGPIAAPPPSPARTPVVAIVIDDLGEDIAATDQAMKLPPQIVMSFLPFAEATPFLVSEAERKGHEVLAHVPMEALSNTDPGPMALRVGLSSQEIAARLNWSLARVPGLSGINNHEGSRFTADAIGLTPVAEILADRHLFFFDSRTSPDSKVVIVAHQFGVASAGRDVFLDDVITPQAIAAQLAELERIARQQGVAIAIGHPHEATLAALANWKHAGIELVPLSVAIRLKTEHAVALAAR